MFFQNHSLYCNRLGAKSTEGAPKGTGRHMDRGFSKQSVYEEDADAVTAAIPFLGIAFFKQFSIDRVISPEICPPIILPRWRQQAERFTRFLTIIKAWTDEAGADCTYWMKQDCKTLKRILQLLKDIGHNGYTGIERLDTLLESAN